MQAFDYRAIDARGKVKRGSVSADSERAARRLLREQGLYTESILPLANARKAARGAGRPGRMRIVELAMVMRQLGVLINSGLPLDTALKLTIEQGESPRERRLCESLRAEIGEGRSFSAAMQRAPYRVPESLIASVGVGEETGHLHTILIRLADELETGAENRQTFTRGLIYPLVLVVGSIAVISFMMAWVVPRITQVFVSSGAELPWITRVVVGISNLVVAFGPYFIALVAIGLMAALVALRQPHIKLAWHEKLLAMPGLGRWILMADISDWARSLGTLLASGVPALSALGISSTLVNNLALRARFEAVTESMRRGTSMHNALRDAGIGSGFLIHMVGSGEASSELSAMLSRVAEYYRSRLAAAVDTFLKLMNPVLIVFIGMVILIIVLAVMLPILEMNDVGFR